MSAVETAERDRDGDGRSVVTRAFATSPLRLLTPRNHGHAAWVYTSSYGGGLVDGDRIRLDVDVGPGAAAFLSTQASTKVYRSPRGTVPDCEARVAADGLLVVAPDPVVCFAAAATGRASPSTSSRRRRWCWSTGCRRGAALPASAGRSMSTRRGSTCGSTAALVLHDALRCGSDDGDLQERLGRFDVLATVLILGATLRDARRRRQRGSPGCRSAAGPTSSPVRRRSAATAGCCGWPARRSRRSAAWCEPSWRFCRACSATTRGRGNGNGPGCGSGKGLHASDAERDRQADAAPGRRPGAEAAGARPAAQLRRGGGADRDAAARVHPRRSFGGRADGPRPAACSAAPTCSTASPR